MEWWRYAAEIHHAVAEWLACGNAFTTPCTTECGDGDTNYTLPSSCHGDDGGEVLKMGKTVT